MIKAEDQTLLATDLRIGNYINDIFGGQCEVRGITIRGIYIRNHSGPAPENAFSGIELNEEWLIRLGFTEGRFGFEIKAKDKFGNIETMFFESGHICIDGFATPAEHVHQLQNLYHSLTNTELTIKP